MSVPNLPVALTIATSDSGCGAGAQADLLTFANRRVFGVTALPALTAQNPAGVRDIFELPAAFLEAQLQQISAYFDIAAFKTGMLFSAPLIEAAARFARDCRVPSVIDPVMVSSSGATLLREDAIATLKEELIPAASLVTPNLDEVEVLLGWRPGELGGMREAARALSREYKVAALVKGGHLSSGQLADVLALVDGSERIFQSARLEGVDTHGSGCTLSAAITAHLARGHPMERAVEAGLAYLRRGMARPLHVAGRAFINHRQ